MLRWLFPLFAPSIVKTVEARRGSAGRWRWYGSRPHRGLRRAVRRQLPEPDRRAGGRSRGVPAGQAAHPGGDRVIQRRFRSPVMHLIFAKCELGNGKWNILRS